jgi:hypothetical protein
MSTDDRGHRRVMSEERGGLSFRLGSALHRDAHPLPARMARRCHFSAGCHAEKTWQAWQVAGLPGGICLGLSWILGALSRQRPDAGWTCAALRRVF